MCPPRQLYNWRDSDSKASYPANPNNLENPGSDNNVTPSVPVFDGVLLFHIPYQLEPVPTCVYSLRFQSSVIP